jgi:predicted ribosomally synthesized peptide with SipW-like signal peptide
MKTKRIQRTQAIMAALALLFIGTGGLVGSGAYFTDQTTIRANSFTSSTIALRYIGDTDNSDFTTKNLLPLTEAAATTGANPQASLITVNVVNVGKSAFGWAASIKNITGATSTLVPAVQLQWRIDSGTWSPTTTLDAFGAITSSPINGTGLAPAATPVVVQIRLWLKPDAVTSLQSLKASYVVRVRAMQNTAPMSGLDLDTEYSTSHPH